MVKYPYDKKYQHMRVYRDTHLKLKAIAADRNISLICLIDHMADQMSDLNVIHNKIKRRADYGSGP